MLLLLGWLRIYRAQEIATKRSGRGPLTQRNTKEKDPPGPRSFCLRPDRREPINSSATAAGLQVDLWLGGLRENLEIGKRYFGKSFSMHTLDQSDTRIQLLRLSPRCLRSADFLRSRPPSVK
jgi:hypothetical protein